MAKSVITTKNIESHNVEPYRFKVLGTTAQMKKKILEEKEEEQEQEQEKQEESKVIKTVQKPDETLFIEELLKKTDELSSNIVKLQIKIENQEQEFEKRLSNETSKAKEEGILEGKKRAEADFEGKVSNLEKQFGRSLNLLEETNETFKAFLKKNESELSEAAIEIAKEVIQKEVSKNSSEISISLAKSLAKELAEATKLEIKVNPKTYEAVKEEFGEFEHIKVGADDAISEGGVVVLSDAGNIDATLSLRLEKIKQMMKE